MAIIKLASPITGIRGTLGGVIYSAARSGPYCRQWSRPPRQRTAAQTTERALWSAAPSIWRDTLTPTQRGDWNTYAAAPAQALTNSLGETYYAHGYAWFLRLSVHLVRMGRSIIAAAPTGSTPATPTISTFVPDSGASGSTTITYPASEWSGYDMVLFTAQSQGEGVLTKTSQFFETYLDQSPGSSSQTFQSEIEAVWGAIQIGQRYHLWGYRQNSEGRRSAPQAISATVTA